MPGPFAYSIPDMTYPPLSQARDTLKPRWYRSHMDPEIFRALSRRSNAQGWLQAGGHLGIFLTTGALAWVFWAHGMWVLFGVALFAHGTVASFFSGTAPHELGHGTVFQTKWLNRAFLYVFSLIGWWNPFDYASSHTYHHRYTLHPDGDRENLLPLHPSVGRTFLLQMFTINLFTQPGRTFGKGGLIASVTSTLRDAMGRAADEAVPSNEWLNTLHADQPDQHRKSILWSRILLAFHGSVLLVSILTGQWVLILILSCASFIANWLSYAVGLTQHCGLRSEVADFRKNTRSVVLPKPVEFLYWHMNWHIEHHMYAGVPCYNLPRLHQAVREDMPKPRTLREAWREMLETWRRQQSDPDYACDTPLPATAKTMRERPGGAEETSIGDLAPKGL